MAIYITSSKKKPIYLYFGKIISIIISKCKIGIAEKLYLWITQNQHSVWFIGTICFPNIQTKNCFNKMWLLFNFAYFQFKKLTVKSYLYDCSAVDSYSPE